MVNVTAINRMQITIIGERVVIKAIMRVRIREEIGVSYNATSAKDGDILPERLCNSFKCLMGENQQGYLPQSNTAEFSNKYPAVKRESQSWNNHENPKHIVITDVRELTRILVPQPRPL